MGYLLSPKIIRAWFDTVLNPIIKGLETELYFLDNNNLTWRGFISSFDALKPLFSFLSFHYKANFEQCSQFNPILPESIDKHDGALAKLNDSCGKLFDELKQSQILKDVYEQKLEKLSKDLILSEQTVSKLSNDNNLRFIAEYVINDLDDLDIAYTLSPIWNLFKDEFKAILENNEFKDSMLSFNNSLNEFKAVVKETCTNLKEFRNNLSLQYGEPLVIPRKKRAV